MRCTLVMFSALVLASGLGLLGAEAQSVDPQSLVGEWRGQFVFTENASSAPYNLTIVKIEEDKVIGRVERLGQTIDIVGTLKGNILTYTGAGNTAQLTISENGKEMRGRSLTTRVNISLTRQ